MTYQPHLQTHLQTHGLYRPEDERDACGVGCIAALDGQPRRQVVESAIAALKAVWHRGAVNADGKTGDGAGIHLQLPEAFFRSELERHGKKLPNNHPYAVGMLFLPRRDFAMQERCRTLVEQEILRLGYEILCWRQVPVNPEVIGEEANNTRPEIAQILLSGKKNEATEQFERNLYLIRRRIEKEAHAQSVRDFYICSLSCRSIIYKGLFKAEQLEDFYPDLQDTRFISRFAIFHQRFSTNTAPVWPLAQPFRIVAHNGEINTVKGNVAWMKSHEANIASPLFGKHMGDIVPVVQGNLSDTGCLDVVMELLIRAGRELPMVKAIMVPPAWSRGQQLSEEHKGLFNYANCVMAPWDGPAALAATDGTWLLAGLDRSGLRPLRYSITSDGLLLVGSESGMVPVKDAEVLKNGKLGPGEMIAVHLEDGKFYDYPALLDRLAARQPYAEWAKNVELLHVPPATATEFSSRIQEDTMTRLQRAAGLTREDMEHILTPMARDGKEAVGSMGDDTPIAVLAKHYRGLAPFFRQHFSQVTNPPIDPIRERGVMSLYTRIGNRGNILEENPEQCGLLLLKTPVVLNADMDALKQKLATTITVLDATFPAQGKGNLLEAGLNQLLKAVDAGIKAGRTDFILSDESMNAERCAIPSILAASAVHTHLVERGVRKQSSLIVRASDCLDAHHFAVLIGLGATAVNAWLAEATLVKRHKAGLLSQLSLEQLLLNYKKAISDGLLKIMSKMGISIISSYRGGKNFEAIGLSRALVARYFPGIASRISGIGLKGIQNRVLALHQQAFNSPTLSLPIGGYYSIRSGGEHHAHDGTLIHLLQEACASGKYRSYLNYAEKVYAQPPMQLRDLLGFDSDRQPLALDKVESITDIRKRFIAPAMSMGALSPEAHETLAIAMNRIGAASNSGEGGEDARRFQPLPNGDNANSSIKQVASGRFGVTADYLNHCSEIQIKVAQGAKPGEGGQLPGFKVTELIGRLRHATPGVTLISPPPHHDIYSIEDLAQLIYDLKQINPDALVSVKLVSNTGIGTIAAGVVKAMADKIIISGHSGGTGASPMTSIKYAGMPWEIGLAETNQVLTLNGLRHRVKLQTDGGLRTGRDIVIAAMLGAEEYAIGTLSLVAMGCLLVRQCHSNTCPVGICTQDEKLRAKFDGSVEKVINLLSFIAEEVREILASLGYSSLDEVVGRTDLLRQIGQGHEDLDALDLAPLLVRADPGASPVRYRMQGRNEVPPTLDAQMMQDAKRALSGGEKVELAYGISNTHRSIGTRLSSHLVRHYGQNTLHTGHITLKLRGSAGQSLGAFGVQGLKIEVIGDANDYVGKGLSGATIVVRPRPSSVLLTQENTIIGNTVLYGATAGFLFAAGQAGERFAVRNSGASAVVEGCGTNGCEYMTGGTVVILGDIGINFGAGMTGGMAFLYDPHQKLPEKLNPETIIHQRLGSHYWESRLHSLIEQHVAETDSLWAHNILLQWEWEKHHFWQICPKEMLHRLEQPLNDTPVQGIHKATA